MTWSIWRWRSVRVSDIERSVQVFAREVKHLFGEQLFDVGVDIEQVFGQTIEHPFVTVTTT